MDRAERRSRTEKVRARRIRRWNSICEWERHKTDDAHAREEWCWWSGRFWTKTPDECWAEVEKWHQDRQARFGKMKRSHCVTDWDDDAYQVAYYRRKLDRNDVFTRMRDAGLRDAYGGGFVNKWTADWDPPWLLTDDDW